MQPKPLSEVDLNLLPVLYQLLAQGSVGGAAQVLGRSQSAVSHSLKRLRTQLDDPLLVRTGQDMLLTPRAEALRAPLEQLMKGMDALLSAPRGFDPSTSDERFRIVAADYPQFVILPRLVKRVRDSAPHVSLAVRPPTKPTSETLVAGEADLCLLPFLPARESGLFSKVLFEDRFVCMLREDHPLIGEALDLATYSQVPHIVISPMGGSGGPVDIELAKSDLRRDVRVTVNQFSTAVPIVATTDMVATVPERLACALPSDSGMRVVDAPLSLPEFRVYQIWPERLNADPAHQWLRNQVTATANDSPAAS